MFEGSVQPSIVSLFSSTSSKPLGLFSRHTDDGLPADSLIHLLDDSTSLSKRQPPATLIASPMITAGEGNNEATVGRTLCQAVLHIQSPTLRTTFIRCPPISNPPNQRRQEIRDEIGLHHKRLHIQVGVGDQANRRGVMHCSTFQKESRLILVPNSLPSTITVSLASLMSHFTSRALRATPDGEEGGQAAQTPNSEVPSGQYSYLAHIKVYATCRLRRIWLSDSGPSQRIPWEFELYAA
ncbi:hypothetical protein BJ138DRAFT_1138381 [Hygrophoropsis aurantiaca]|uniref:Uncharacterized protein n=1 Tax=Hygrophoropsis aurantiaca TaxID=72124 RepID=A0ACB7ZVF1_9AGAM|nr:hypothetical protein BJ138DRAFT_1138381 [Hygrophoropsis aurantiaca]